MRRKGPPGSVDVLIMLTIFAAAGYALFRFL
jgi:hypothetical protein